MSFGPAAPPVSPALPSPEGWLAPIVPLDSVRRRRQASAPAPADRDALQREVLRAAVQGGRLCSADLFAMVRLGILTDDVNMLPCADPHRRENPIDWERRYVDARGRLEPKEATPSQVGCPIMAQAASGGAPACIEALRHGAQIPAWRPEGGFARRPIDPADPVVNSDLRPCLLLSRELFRHLLLPLWQDAP